MNEQYKVPQLSAKVLKRLLVFLVCLSGCGTNAMPPPNKPKPEKQSTAAGLEMAEQLYAAVQEQDTAAVEQLRKPINDEIAAALNAGDGDREHDFGRLNAVIYLADQGQWAEAEETLQQLVQNSKETTTSK